MYVSPLQYYAYTKSTILMPTSRVIYVYYRRAVLRKWKEKHQLCGTYENLLKISCDATATDVAMTIFEILKSRVQVEGNYS